MVERSSTEGDRNLLAELVEEFLAQMRAGAAPSIETYAARHPELAAEVRELLAVLVSVRTEFGCSGESPARATGSDDSSEPRSELEPNPEQDSSNPIDSAQLVRRLSNRATVDQRYRVRGEVARGGMGTVYRVWDEDLRRTLAMKVMRERSLIPDANDSGAGTRNLARFLEEAQITGQLDHPGIVPVHELGLDSQGRLFFTMRLVKGRDLKEIIALVHSGAEGWTQTKALSVILRVCEAMAYAHEKGVIHRDLKPANIMVGRFGETYVMDWGLAKVAGHEDQRDIRPRARPGTTFSSVQTTRSMEAGESPESPLITMDGSVIGTPAYMSPEQARGEVDQVGQRSDVYSAGAMLYHLLTGQMPYVPEGARVSAHAVLRFVLEGPPKPAHQVRRNVPTELEAICEKAMSRTAERRYSGMLEMANDLQAYIHGRVVRAHESGAWADARKWIGRNRALSMALAGVVVVLVAGVVVSSMLSTAYKYAAKQSRHNATVAQQNEARALEQERIATQRAKHLMSLSAFQTLDDLTKEADSLWPAEPRLVERYREWLEKAEDLVAKLPEFRASLSELEQRALPQSAEERAEERATHPRAQELREKSAELVWMKRMLGEEPWPDEAEVEVALTKETLPADANALDALAWPLVDPDQPEYGSETRALLLARRAAEAGAEKERYQYRHTLSWALFRVGRLDDALVEEKRALEEADHSNREDYAHYLTKLEGAVTSWRDSTGTAHDAKRKADDPLRGDRSARVKERDTLAQEVVALESEVSKRRAWRFAEEALGGESADRWWQAQTSKLIAALESFGDEKTGLVRGVSNAHGWGVAERLAFASSVEERTLSSAEAKRLWLHAIESISASSRYKEVRWTSGTRLTPQLGLLPIGEDAHSGLWEFAHVQSGEPALRGTDGELVLKGETGLVLVLIPGGKFWMGAQNTNPSGRNYTTDAQPVESPVHEVTLSAYFLSKYEMTQGQWLRIAGHNPSFYGPSLKINGHQHNLTHPVEQVTWTASMTLLERLGLLLPSEAQWEFGCRGGTDTSWWTGREREGLRGKINLADQTAKSAGATWTAIDDWPGIEDGWVVHAPVGSLAANPYGLHDVHGNVWEWCRDGLGEYSAGTQVDPIATSPGALFRVFRGGSYSETASLAGSGHRHGDPPMAQDEDLGLRPARAVRPFASGLGQQEK